MVGLRVRLRGLLLKHLQAEMSSKVKAQNDSGFVASLLKTVELEWRKCGYEPVRGILGFYHFPIRRVATGREPAC